MVSTANIRINLRENFPAIWRVALFCSVPTLLVSPLFAYAILINGNLFDLAFWLAVFFVGSVANGLLAGWLFVRFPMRWHGARILLKSSKLLYVLMVAPVTALVIFMLGFPNIIGIVADPLNWWEVSFGDPDGIFFGEAGVFNGLVGVVFFVRHQPNSPDSGARGAVGFFFRSAQLGKPDLFKATLLAPLIVPALFVSLIALMSAIGGSIDSLGVDGLGIAVVIMSLAYITGTLACIVIGIPFFKLLQKLDRQLGWAYALTGFLVPAVLMLAIYFVAALTSIRSLDSSDYAITAAIFGSIGAVVGTTFFAILKRTNRPA